MKETKGPKSASSHKSPSGEVGKGMDRKQSQMVRGRKRRYHRKWED